MFKIGYYQFRPLFGKPDKNLAKIVNALQGVEADLMVLPELPFSGYYFRDREEVYDFAEEIQTSDIIAKLTALCRKKQMHIVTGFAERFNDKLFNSALLISGDGICAVYRKIHLFNKEKEWFDPGESSLTVQTISDVRIGMIICFDYAFPEAARKLALQGADVICHPSNLVLNHGQKVMTARSFENGVYTITANRCGTERRPHGDLRFTGKSQLVNPRGEILHRAPAQREELFVTTIDIDPARDKKLTPFNDLLKDRRPEFY